MIELNIPEAAPVATPEAQAPEAATPAPAADNPQGTPAVATAPSTPSPSTPATPEAGEPKFEIKVDGKTQMLTRQEMIDRAQMGTDYRQKTQKLADEQRRWEADRQSILQQERENAVRAHNEQKAREAAEAAKDPATRANERVAALEQKLEDQQLESVLKSLLTKYDVDEQQFLIEASKQGLRSVADVTARGEEIAKALSESQNGRFETKFKDVLSKGEHPEIKAYREKILAEYLAKKTAGPAPLGPGLSPTAPATPRKARTLDEAADIAEEMLTGVAPRY